MQDFHSAQPERRKITAVYAQKERTIEIRKHNA
jgi:hypothetical protein